MERVTRRYVGHTVATKFRPGTHFFIHRNLLGSFLFSRARFANRISKNEGLGSTRGYLPHLLEAPSFMAKETENLRTFIRTLSRCPLERVSPLVRLCYLPRGVCDCTDQG
jgi:hypothetical protein